VENLTEKLFSIIGALALIWFFCIAFDYISPYKPVITNGIPIIQWVEND
jgi:hypothetical protein